MHVEGGGDRYVRPDDLAHRAEDVALRVIDRLGRHRTVKGKHHAIDVVAVLAERGEDALADRRIGVVGDDRTDPAEHVGRGDQGDAGLGGHVGDRMPLEALSGGRAKDIVAVDDRACPGEDLRGGHAGHEAVELVGEPSDEDPMATADHLLPSSDRPPDPDARARLDVRRDSAG